ncbi:bifunctional diguanylate cyclase/phosphodiesterase [Roseateles koreensis]|uniref:EAL domain-containing protein n=1 Tax=Roseateles koreensis TaxID=2987526 RepID=A0ABT5KR62_9BURK|nr:EAL domain-containing protein [Roseateles koreensis]MDC8785403.1 EAL domain-containing protein [Roseateles koreensis]
MANAVDISNEELQRLKALHEFSVLDTAAEPAFDDLTQLAAQLFAAPIALVTFIDGNRQWIKACQGIAIRETPRSVAMCDLTIRGAEVLVIEDALLDNRTAQNPLVTGPPGLRFYAGAPLITPEGFALGSLCILDTRPRSFDAQQCVCLQQLARQVMSQLMLRRQNRQLTDTLTEIQHVDAKRRESEAIYALLFANSMDGVLQTRSHSVILSANPMACEILGLREDQLCGMTRKKLLKLDDPRLPPLLNELERMGKAHGEVTMIRGDGEYFEADISIVTYRDEAGEDFASVVFRDVTERRVWARKVEQSLELLGNLARRVPGALVQYRLDAEGSASYPYCSEGIYNIYEVSPQDLRNNDVLVRQRVHPDDAADLADSIRRSAATLQPWHHEFRVMLPRQGLRWRLGSGQPERLADNSVLWHAFLTDITERKQSEQHTHWLAYYDVLTGLPNRRMLLDRIAHDLAVARRSRQQGAVMFIDLDNFKHINDALGHSVGDDLLKQVAQRLRKVAREGDTVARLGGDEFVVLVSNLGLDGEHASRHAMAVAEKLREVLVMDYRINDHSYSVSGSIGITLFPKGAEAVDDLLREADTAMYRAKAAGRNRVAFFEALMHVEVQDRLHLERDLREALLLEQFHLHLQSQFNAEGTEIGGELLLRWQHPLRGAVSPLQFIPVAEDSGLIIELGNRVLRQACLALARLQKAGCLQSLSVNVSPRQFRRDDFVDGLRRIIFETGAPASFLILEVTEGLLIENWQDTIARMSELGAMGLRFSIDDFGTGYSSLAYLKKLPLYELKVDKSFVQDTPSDPNDTVIVEAVVSMAKHLNLRVVAEGVETQAQRDFLVAAGCDCLQGYLLARPGPLEDWLLKRGA